MSINRFTGADRFLSNFWPAPVALDGEIYATVEHAYQAAKTLDPSWQARIRYASTPGDAKRTGKWAPLRPDWEEIKLRIMENLLRQKFADEELRNALLATTPHSLIEGNTWGDRFWGMCGGTGENHLGKLLMKIRAESRQT